MFQLVEVMFREISAGSGQFFLSISVVHIFFELFLVDIGVFQTVLLISAISGLFLLWFGLFLVILGLFQHCRWVFSLVGVVIWLLSALFLRLSHSCCGYLLFALF
jgi:hypothetical protein